MLTSADAGVDTDDVVTDDVVTDDAVTDDAADELLSFLMLLMGVDSISRSRSILGFESAFGAQFCS